MAKCQVLYPLILTKMLICFCLTIECEPEHQISPSVFTELLSDSVAKQGEPCSLLCRAAGNPLPTVQWYKDDVCIDNSAEYQITYNNGEALLTIERADTSHGGKYACVATNRLGSDRTTSKLSVEGKSKMLTTTVYYVSLKCVRFLSILETLVVVNGGPKFLVPLSNVMARAGQKLKLECEVETDESPTLIWFHDGKVMKEIKDFQVRITFHQSSTGIKNKTKIYRRCKRIVICLGNREPRQNQFNHPGGVSQGRGRIRVDHQNGTR